MKFTRSDAPPDPPPARLARRAVADDHRRARRDADARAAARDPPRARARPAVDAVAPAVARALIAQGPMQATAPDLIRAVIGFRQWRLHGDELWSLHADDRWVRGLQTARCLGEAAHEGPAPQNGCTCGFYAWYAPTPRTASAATSELVGGAVALWGQVELHAHGIRAQHAMIVALALPMSWGSKRRRLVAVANALEVPAVPARRLRATALEHGDVIPRQHAPARHDAQQARRAGAARPGAPLRRGRRPAPPALAG